MDETWIQKRTVINILIFFYNIITLNNKLVSHLKRTTTAMYAALKNRKIQMYAYAENITKES